MPPCTHVLLALVMFAAAVPAARAQALPAANRTTSVDAAHARTPRPAPAKRDARTTPHVRSTPQPQVDVQLAPIVVRADAPDAAIRAQQRLTPGAVNIVNGATFYQRPVTNLADALRYLPGVSVVSNTGGDDAVLSIRGSNLSALGYDNSGVALFQDGLPVTTADGANHNRLLDPLAAQAIIVANGANALAYGASDLGGAINVISRTALNSDPRQVYVTGGEHGLINGRVSAGGVSGDFDGILTVDGKHFGGYQQHSRENRTSVYGNAGWRVSNTLKLRAFGTYIDSRQQLAGALTRAEFEDDPRQADPSYVLGNHQLDVKTGRGALKGTWNITPASSLQFGASYEVQSLYHPIVDVFDFRTYPLRHLFSLLIDTTQRTTGGMLRYRLTYGNHDLLLGLNLAHTSDTGGNYENRAGRRGPQTDRVDQRSGNATLFAVDRWQLAPRWTLVYGAQGVVTRRNVRDIHFADHGTRDQKHTYSAINPRLGVLYTLGRHSEAFASVSRVYEAPNNFDLNNDVHKNNTVEDAMHGVSWEIGTRSTAPVALGAGTWHWSAALYYSAIRDEILSVEDPTQPGNLLSTNYAHTIHAGVEVLAGGSFPLAGAANRIEPLISISWNHFRFHHDPDFGNNRLPSAPRYVIHGQILYRNRSTGFYVGPTFDLAGSRYADMANTYHVAGYVIAGLRIGVERKQWTLFAQVRNLADKRYVNTVTVRTQAGPDARVLNAGAPRSVFVGVHIRY